MNDTNGGRPPKYTDEELLDEIKNYRKTHQHKKITLSALAKESGIPLHIWKYRMKDYINQINVKSTDDMLPTTHNFDLPSGHDMVLKCNGDEELIENYFTMLLDIISSLEKYRDAEATIKDMKENYENKIHRLELQVEEKEQMIMKLNDMMNKYILNSNSLEKRKKEGIKDNIIAFNKNNMNTFSNMFEELTH